MTSLFDDLLGSTQTRPTSPFNLLGNRNSLHLDHSDQNHHRKNDVAWFNDCTEIIGSESGHHFTPEEDDKLDSSVVLLHSTAAGKSRLSTSTYSGSTTRVVVVQDFPPAFLSTLSRDGRPIFVLKKVRVPSGESFRLLITMERDERPRVERYFCSEEVYGVIKKIEEEDR